MSISTSNAISQHLQTTPDTSEKKLGVNLKGVIQDSEFDFNVKCQISNRWFLGRKNSQLYKSSRQVNTKKLGWETRLGSNWNALDGLIDSDINAVVIDIKRVRNVRYYHYMGNRGLHQELYEPWSSNKFMAVSAAFAKIRALSHGRVGGNSLLETGEYVGDLVTQIHDYSGDSNALARYFLNIAGGGLEASAFLGPKWLNMVAPGNFDGFWGKPGHAGGKIWHSLGHGNATVEVDTLDAAVGSDKYISALAQAEWLKRLTQHNTDRPTRMPALKPDDLKVLFYGGVTSELALGGMSSGVSLYLPNALNGTSETPADDVTAAPLRQILKDNLDFIGGNNWRMFSKVGWGNSTLRDRSETVFAGYACLPEVGREFVIVSRASLPRILGVSAAHDKNQRAITAIVGYLKRLWAQD